MFAARRREPHRLVAGAYPYTPAMGVWREHVVPRVTDVMLGTGEVRGHRERVITGLRGEVVEIGFGSGLNVPFYPAEVETVYAVDPSAVGRKLATKRARRVTRTNPVRRARRPGSPARRRIGRRRAQHLHAVHHPGRHASAARAAPRVATGRAVPLPRARPVPRAGHGALAAPPQRVSATARGRVQPRSSDRPARAGCGLRDPGAAQRLVQGTGGRPSPGATCTKEQPSSPRP